MTEWKGVGEVERWVEVPAGKDGLTVEGLPPGDYDVSRIKNRGISGPVTLLDRVEHLSLVAGKTAGYDLVRPKGTRITGVVSGLPKEGYDGVRISIHGYEETNIQAAESQEGPGGDPVSVPDSPVARVATTFDDVALRDNGPFTTERIPPGEYRVIVAVYRKQPSFEGFRPYLPLTPHWRGEAKVTVPADGEGPHVEVKVLDAVRVRPPRAEDDTGRIEQEDTSIVTGRMADTKGNSLEAELEFDKDLTVNLQGAAGGRPDILRLATIRFEKNDDRIRVRLVGKLLTGPKGRWNVRVTLLDAARTRAGRGGQAH